MLTVPLQLLVPPPMPPPELCMPPAMGMSPASAALEEGDEVFCEETGAYPFERKLFEVSVFPHELCTKVVFRLILILDGEANVSFSFSLRNTYNEFFLSFCFCFSFDI